jgi:Lipocalin-like domain
MNRRSMLTATTMALLALLTGGAVGQTAKDLVGTWTWVQVDLTRPDGTKYQPFGTNPKGFVIFDSNGRFAYLLSRPDRPKFAANNRDQGTPEERSEPGTLMLPNLSDSRRTEWTLIRMLAAGATAR